jgi:hypothetical protein
MTEKESLLKERLTERQSRLIERFKERYPSRTIENEMFFESPNGRVFTVDIFLHFESIFLEWADSFEKAPGGREDGDLYSIEMTEEEMFRAMLKEIEG